MEIKFFIEIDPPTATAQEKKIAVRNGRTFVYDNPRVKQAKQLLTLELMKHKPSAPLKGPLLLQVMWDFPKGRHECGWKTTRPDTDNLNKMLKDVMTKCGYWTDDAQVCAEQIYKTWADTPGIAITLYELEEQT